MARKAAAKPVDGENTKPHAEKFGNVTWVNYDLSKDEQAALKLLPFWSDEWDSYLLRACDEGYRFTIKYDGFSKAYACYMSNPLNSHPNFGLMLTGRGSVPTKALRQVLYKHVVISKENWRAIMSDAPVDIDD